MFLFVARKGTEKEPKRAMTVLDDFIVISWLVHLEGLRVVRRFRKTALRA